MSGCLIGAENSGLKCRKFGTHFGQSTDCLGGLCYNICNKLWFGHLVGPKTWDLIVGIFGSRFR